MIPPDSRVVASPHYLRVAILVVLLLLAYVYATAVERRLERRVPTDPRATIFVAHACLVLIALLVLLVNPYSLLLVLPAAVLWPLARPGGWTRSILPALRRTRDDPRRVRLLRDAARPGLEGVVVLLPAAGESHRPGGSRSAGRRVRLHGRRCWRTRCISEDRDSRPSRPTAVASRTVPQGAAGLSGQTAPNGTATEVGDAGGAPAGDARDDAERRAAGASRATRGPAPSVMAAAGKRERARASRARRTERHLVGAPEGARSRRNGEGAGRTRPAPSPSLGLSRRLSRLTATATR